MINYPVAADIQQSILIGKWNGIPVYHVSTMYAFNQLVGYVKLINSDKGTVLYRGQCDIFPKVLPSIFHNEKTQQKNDEYLNTAINNILHDPPFVHFLGFRNPRVEGWNLYEKLITEAMFQHYGAKTYSVDFVDNHWTSLWFGLYRWDEKSKKYVIRCDTEVDYAFEKGIISREETYQKKKYSEEPNIDSIVLNENKMQELKDCASHGSIGLEELIRRNKKTKLKNLRKSWEHCCLEIDSYNCEYDIRESSAHLYIFLYVSETNVSNVNGLYIGDETYTIDLRKALPSTFLRPCSQHGWIVRGIDISHDFCSRIACVIRLNVKLAKDMLGNGTLLSEDNFFPNSSIDQGYSVLLQRQVSSTYTTKYPKIIPENMIPDFNL